MADDHFSERAVGYVVVIAKALECDVHAIKHGADRDKSARRVHRQRSHTTTRVQPRGKAALDHHLKRDGDARLTGSKYLWLHRPADLPPEQRLVLRALQREDFRVGRAWVLKERFRTFWEYRYAGAARTFFTRWFWRATHSRLKPMAAVAKLIQRHLPNRLTYLRHCLTNAGLEGLNARLLARSETTLLRRRRPRWLARRAHRPVRDVRR